MLILLNHLFRSKIEAALSPPQQGMNVVEPPAGDPNRFFKRLHELNHRQRRHQRRWIVPERDRAHVIEPEPPENVLEVEHGVVSRGGREYRYQPVVELGVHDVFHELAQRLGVELVAGDLSLELPALAVDVEYAIAEEVGEDGSGEAALLVNVEVGLEDVLDVGRVGRIDGAGAEGAVKDEGGGGRTRYYFGRPLDASVDVCVD